MYGGTPVKKSSKDLLTNPTPTANGSVLSSEFVSRKDDDDNNLNIDNDGSNNYEVSDSSKMPESILRLLQCIKRLGDENVFLLQRIGMKIKDINSYHHISVIKSLSFYLGMNRYYF
jgi:hypothetical protein